MFTGQVCGDGFVDPAEECDDLLPCCDTTTCMFILAAQLEPCRNASGSCDTVEYCDGIPLTTLQHKLIKPNNTQTKPTNNDTKITQPLKQALKRKILSQKI